MCRIAWTHPLFALVLPAVLIGIGVWQLSRADGVAEGFDTRAGRVEASMERLRPLATRDPGARVTFHNADGVELPIVAAAGMARLDEARGSLRTDALVERARAVAAWVAVAGGAVAFLAALVGLLATKAGAARGERDRQRLVASFRTVVRVLPPLLGLIAVATALGIVGAVLFEVGGAWFWQDVDTGDVKLVLIGFVLVGVMLFAAFESVRQLRRSLRAFTPQPMTVLGRPLTPTDAPGLWGFVRDLAARQGAAAPDNIVVGLTQGFFVTSSAVRAMPGERLLTGKSLYVPATYVPLVSEAETTAIIAHELAHFTGEDTDYSRHFLPLYASMSRTMAAVAQRHGAREPAAAGLFAPAAIVARYVLVTFDRAVAHWSRLREFEADRASLRAGDARHGATALLRTGMAAQLIGGALDDVYRHPTHAGPDVVGSVVANARAIGFADPGRHLEDRQPHPTDTHPPTRQRIEALGVPIDDALLAEASRPLAPADDAFADKLFADWPALSRQLGDDLVAAARADDAAYEADLTEAAGAITAETPIHERGVMFATVTLGTIAAVFLATAVALVVGALTGWEGMRFDGFILGAIAVFAGLGLVFLWFALVRYRRGRAGPFLVVGRDGFRCIGIAGEVPWSAVRGVQVSVGQRFLTVFHLAAEAMPQQVGRTWTVKLDRKRHTLTLSGYVPRGLKSQAYLDLLNRALRAERARAALRVREAEATELR